MELLGIILVLTGCLMVYGSGLIAKVFKQQNKDSFILVIKASGLLIGAAGCMRIFHIF